MLYPDCKDKTQLNKPSMAFPLPILTANQDSLSSFRSARQNDSAICSNPKNADLQLDIVDDAEKKGKVHLKRLIMKLRKLNSPTNISSLSTHECESQKQSSFQRRSNHASLQLSSFHDMENTPNVFRLEDIDSKQISCRLDSTHVNGSIIDCTEKFSTVDEMLRHVRKYHFKLNECMICSHCFSMKEKLIDHMEL